MVTDHNPDPLWSTFESSCRKARCSSHRFWRSAGRLPSPSLSLQVTMTSSLYSTAIRSLSFRQHERFIIVSTHITRESDVALKIACLKQSDCGKEYTLPALEVDKQITPYNVRVDDKGCLQFGHGSLYRIHH